MYNYFYMIEIIQAARSIIPAMELTFLSLHIYLYSKAASHYFTRFVVAEQAELNCVGVDT